LLPAVRHLAGPSDQALEQVPPRRVGERLEHPVKPPRIVKHMPKYRFSGL
jgi:hypothetical protein